MKDIDKINHSRLTLINARDQWEEASGSKVDDHVGITIADIEYAALHTITDLQVKLGELQPAVSTAPIPEKTEGNHPTYGAGLIAAKPAQTTTKKSSRGSRRSKKTSSSTAIKLQLRTDEAALAINERFDKERSERSASTGMQQEQQRTLGEPKKKPGGREKRFKDKRRELIGKLRESGKNWRMRTLRELNLLNGRKKSFRPKMI